MDQARGLRQLSCHRASFLDFYGGELLPSRLELLRDPYGHPMEKRFDASPIIPDSIFNVVYEVARIISFLIKREGDLIDSVVERVRCLIRLMLGTDCLQLERAEEA